MYTQGGMLGYVHPGRLPACYMLTREATRLLYANQGGMLGYTYQGGMLGYTYQGGYPPVIHHGRLPACYTPIREAYWAIYTSRTAPRGALDPFHCWSIPQGPTGPNLSEPVRKRHINAERRN